MTFFELVDILPLQLKVKLYNLKTLKERSDYHPEDNTFEHIKIVTERCISTGDNDLIMAGIFHDIGKLDAAFHVKENNYGTLSFYENLSKGKVKTYGHEHIAANIVDAYHWFVQDFGADYDTVRFLVSEHMRIKQLDKMKKQKVDILKSNPNFNKLLIFTDADNMLKEFTHGQG